MGVTVCISQALILLHWQNIPLTLEHMCQKYTSSFENSYCQRFLPVA